MSKHSLITAADDLRKDLRGLEFPDPVAYTYNPLEYAWDRHCDYLKNFGSGTKKVLFLGMNPGPYGMAQTGVPFGEISHVRDWMGISDRLKNPTPNTQSAQSPVLTANAPRFPAVVSGVYSPNSLIQPKPFLKTTLSQTSVPLFG